MKTLVIHDTSDDSTKFLKIIYDGHPEWTLINKNISKSKLKLAIKEHDRIVMLGHGTKFGLFGFDRYVIDSSYVYLLRDKVCFCVWCYANDFVEKYDLKGFYTGMVISELDESYYCSVHTSLDEIEASNYLFAEAMQKAINSPNMLEAAHNVYNGNGEIFEFNKESIFIR